MDRGCSGGRFVAVDMYRMAPLALALLSLAGASLREVTASDEFSANRQGRDLVK